MKPSTNNDLTKRNSLLCDFAQFCVEYTIKKDGKKGPRKTPKQVQQAMLELSEQMNKL